MEALQEEASEDGAVAEEVAVDSAGAATLVRAVSHVAAAAAEAGGVVASAGEGGKAVRQSHGIIVEFSICRWDFQNLPRLGRFSAFRKRKGDYLLSKDLCKRMGCSIM